MALSDLFAPAWIYGNQPAMDAANAWNAAHLKTRPKQKLPYTTPTPPASPADAQRNAITNALMAGGVIPEPTGFGSAMSMGDIGTTAATPGGPSPSAPTPSTDQPASAPAPAPAPAPSTPVEAPVSAAPVAAPAGSGQPGKGGDAPAEVSAGDRVSADFANLSGTNSNANNPAQAPYAGFGVVPGMVGGPPVAAPQVSAPQVTAPQVTAPQAPQATAPQAPQAAPFSGSLPGLIGKAGIDAMIDSLLGGRGDTTPATPSAPQAGNVTVGPPGSQSPSVGANPSGVPGAPTIGGTPNLDSPQFGGFGFGQPGGQSIGPGPMDMGNTTYGGGYSPAGTTDVNIGAPNPAMGVALGTEPGVLGGVGYQGGSTSSDNPGNTSSDDPGGDDGSSGGGGSSGSAGSAGQGSGPGGVGGIGSF